MIIEAYAYCATIFPFFPFCYVLLVKMFVVCRILFPLILFFGSRISNKHLNGNVMESDALLCLHQKSKTACQFLMEARLAGIRNVLSSEKQLRSSSLC